MGSSKLNLICLEMIPERRLDINSAWYYLSSYQQSWFWPNIADWGVVESVDGLRRIYTISWKDQTCYNNTQGDPNFKAQVALWNDYNNQNNIIKDYSRFEIINYKKIQDAVTQVKLAANLLLVNS
jgi:hypothetical protein